MTAPHDHAAGTVIGARQLVAVQTFAIARLTSDPVALIPNTFIAVTGRGPKDSNESGKTSFLAACALLLGDPEWQMTGNGTANAVTLLFEPNTAGASAHLARAAERGYVVGVFADPDGSRPHTVWLQISVDSPHVQVRHQAGVHLLTDGTDNERHDEAPAFFSRLGAEVLRSGEFAARLYGRSPRTLAYVATRGQMRSRPSLLKLDAGTYTPDRIGEALITLAGRSGLLERDKGQRKELAGKREEHERALARHDKALAQEEGVLRQVLWRTQLRDKAGQARGLWQAALARGVLDAAARLASASALAPTAEAQLRVHRERHAELMQERQACNDLKGLEREKNRAEAVKQRRQSDLLAAELEASRLESDVKSVEGELGPVRRLSAEHGGEPTGVLAQRHGDLVSEREQARVDREIARREAGQFAEQLDAARTGQAGLAGQIVRALAEQAITATALHHAIELDPDTRDRWEALLHPWRDAVCVPPAAVSRALEVLTGLPGALLVAAPQQSPGQAALPDGIRSAPPSAVEFLRTLAQQSSWTAQPPHAAMPQLGVHIVGAFPGPVVGRRALCAHLVRSRDAALKRSADADRDCIRLDRQITLVQEELRRAQAAELLPQLLAQHKKAEEALTVQRGKLPELVRLQGDAEAAWSLAEGALRSRRDRIAYLDQEIGAAGRHRDKQQQLRDQLAQITDSGILARAVSAFGADEETARAVLGWPVDWLPDTFESLLEHAPAPAAGPSGTTAVERRPVDHLRHSARSTVEGCLTALDLEAPTSGYPTTALAGASAAHKNGAVTDLAAFTEGTLHALEDWLTETAAGDAHAEESIATVRAERESENAFIAASVSSLSDDLRHTQDAIAQRVISSLQSISAQLEALNRSAGGYGADLTFQVDPPSDSDHAWHCSVTPRWRRNPEGPLLAYSTVTNTAQEKIFSIHLVLAALLAAPNATGRVLILDELGDSLGQEHRREVLDAITYAASTHGITVLGTCQDTLMGEVAPLCGEILYFHYPSKSDALNRPTRMFGYDAAACRVELTAAHLLRSIT